MFARLAFAALLLGTAGLQLASGPAKAGPAQDYLYEELRFRDACPPPLKYAAGACVRFCPAGFEDLGGYCRLFNQGSNSGRW
jgi:hypothetical protein